MTKPTNGENAALHQIAQLSDPEKLKAMISNAQRLGSTVVEQRAFRRLCEVQPTAEPGTVEFAVWQSIFALEEMLRQERMKTVRLSRTRQKIQKDGEIKTAADLTEKPEASQGFHDLIERGFPELAFEAIVLKHMEKFGQHTIEAAKTRFQKVGIDPAQFTPSEGA